MNQDPLTIFSDKKFIIGKNFSKIHMFDLLLFTHFAKNVS